MQIRSRPIKAAYYTTGRTSSTPAANFEIQGFLNGTFYLTSLHAFISPGAGPADGSVQPMWLQVFDSTAKATFSSNTGVCTALPGPQGSLAWDPVYVKGPIFIDNVNGGSVSINPPNSGFQPDNDPGWPFELGILAVISTSATTLAVVPPDAGAFVRYTMSAFTPDIYSLPYCTRCRQQKCGCGPMTPNRAGTRRRP